MPNPKYDEEGYVAPKQLTASDTSDSEARAAAARRRAGLTAGKGTGVKKAKTKTVVTPGTKVSQATIDKIKAMGMKKALAGAGGASAEMREGLKRLYGAKRVGASTTSSTTGRAGASTPSSRAKVNNTSSRSASPAGGKASVLKSRDTGKVISTGGRGVTGSANLKPSSSSNSRTPTYRKPETISTGGRGVTGQGTMKRSTSKSTGKKTSNRMDTLFGKK